MSLRPNFIESASNSYQAQVIQLEPGDTAARIDAWVKEKTRGKIEAIVDSLPPDLVLEILNTVYFHGAWDEKFEQIETRERPFHLLGGSVEQLPMMSRFGAYPYVERPGFQAVALPYEGGIMSFYVVLPKSPSSLDEVVASLASDTGWDWVQQLESGLGEVVLPRFTLSYDLTMNEVLKKMGMVLAFGPGRADFSGMVGGALDVWISRVRHKSWVEVNEQGTEAAAATEVQMSRSVEAIIVRKPFRLVVDRPFLLVVRDRMTGLVLFLGAVTHPQRL